MAPSGHSPPWAKKWAAFPRGPQECPTDAYARILKYLVSSSPVLRMQPGEDEWQASLYDCFSPSHPYPWRRVWASVSKVLFPRRNIITLNKKRKYLKRAHEESWEFFGKLLIILKSSSKGFETLLVFLPSIYIRKNRGSWMERGMGREANSIYSRFPYRNEWQGKRHLFV